MKALNFNTGWTWRRLTEDGPGTPVTLPHDAMLGEARSETSAGGINTGWYEGNDYIYSKNFHVPAEWKDRALVLEFEGVYHNAEVGVNGVKRMFRPYGYTNFYLDLTGLLNYGAENRLEVIARNADQPNSRWYSGAGIYRPVTLWTAPCRHIPQNGVKLRTVSLDPPTVEAQVRTVGTGPVTIALLNADGTAAAQTTVHSDGMASATLTVPDARLWSLEEPNLYTCRVTFGEDEEEFFFGLRTLEWGEQGMLLNGKRVILKGACIHHDHGILGACCYPDAEERRVRLLKENGYNALRSAHNPCSKALLDACDRQGMLMMDEYIDHWYIHKTEHDYVDYFKDWWKQDLADMVDKDYNHPCVVLYSTGNEVSETAQPKGIALTGEMTEYLHSLDSGRPVTCGVNIFFNFLSSIGFGVYSDEKARKEAAEAEKRRQTGEKAKKKASVGSKFFNDLAGLMGAGFMKRGATLHGCDVKTRDAFANMDVAGYNYGILRYRHDLKKYPQRLILGSETFCSDAYQFMELAKQEPRILGDFVWAGMDYLGEVAIGSWEYSDYAPRFDGGEGWVSAGSGRIDLTGKPLGEALYTRVALEQDPGPYIAVRPVNHTGDKHSPSAWKMSNATDSWSWRGCAGNKADVEVYARAARVELQINGKTVGEKRLKNDCLARFTCQYEDGTITAVAYDEAGRELGRRSLTTAGADTELRLEAEQMQVQPGGLCYLRLRYTDKAGITKPLERGVVRLSVEGGRLLGTGSGCPYQERSFLSEETDTYYGEALAVVQAGEDGVLTVCAEDGRFRVQTSVQILSK